MSANVLDLKRRQTPGRITWSPSIKKKKENKKRKITFNIEENLKNISNGRVMALFLCFHQDSHRLVYGSNPVEAVGVILCCVSLPQSQGNSSKNSVVSSSSTKDSSMSSSAPMVPHLYLVLSHCFLWHHFHIFNVQFCPFLLLLLFLIFFVTSHVEWNLLCSFVLSIVLHPLPLCFCSETKTVMLAVDFDNF